MCKVEGCNRLSQTSAGFCIMHYKRWKRNGTTDRVLRTYADADRCEHCGNSGSLRKGLCKACHIRLGRKGYVERDVAPKGSGTITKAGYKLMTVLGEREYEHRIVAKAKIGEVIHHDDENKLNNTLDNLIKCKSQSEHMKLHWAKKRESK